MRKFVTLALSSIIFIGGCTGDSAGTSETSVWLSPEAGTSVNLGDSVNLQLNVPEEADSVVYFADGVKLKKASDEKSVTIDTDGLGLGMKAITAKIYRKGAEAEEISTNIVLKSTLIPKKFSYTVEKVFDHDTSSYTQGLEFHNGYFYESDGMLGQSSLRKTDPPTGKVLQLTDIRDEIFAEGITIIGDKIFMLTYQNHLYMEYDLNTLKLIREFPSQYPREGWGLCNDGERIYSTDGTNMIYFLNKDTYMQEGYIEVYDQNGPVDQLNELEYIDGQIYANIYGSYRIVIINPENGQVTGEIDLTDLYPESERPVNDIDFVLNGIAWDKKGKRLFVTGKKWDKLFQIRLSE